MILIIRQGVHSPLGPIYDVSCMLRSIGETAGVEIKIIRLTVGFTGIERERMVDQTQEGQKKIRSDIVYLPRRPTAQLRVAKQGRPMPPVWVEKPWLRSVSYILVPEGGTERFREKNK